MLQLVQIFSCVHDHEPTDAVSSTTLSHDNGLGHGPVAMYTRSHVKQVQSVQI